MNDVESQRPADDQALVVEILDEFSQYIAIILRAGTTAEKIRFVTPNDFQQQVAVMNRPRSERILAHTHLPVPRSVRGTQEVLVIQAGSMLVDLYDSNKNFVVGEVAHAGDVVILVSGGHGFTMLEDCRFIEVKQGPYVPGRDKEVFEASGVGDTH
jgi:hypothetical protein